jgi:hypothetical protein
MAHIGELRGWPSKIHGVMAHDSFDPRAFVDNKAMVFSKDMEGLDRSPNLVETATPPEPHKVAA